MNLFKNILQVLHTADATEKADLVLKTYDQCYQKNLSIDLDIQPPNTPARPDLPILLPPNKMPKRSKGPKKKNILIHAIAHIELNAIDLACDMIVRFCDHDLPHEFYHDWLKVAYDESRHFHLLNNYLKENDSFYGAFPAHNSLWDAAFDTRNDLAARLAVVPMVLEARGLDVTPAMIEQLTVQKDFDIADILTQIYNDEISHVYIGVKWFEYVTKQPIETATTLFHDYLKKYFRGRLIPPFNIPARDKALMPQDFYQTYDPV